MVIHSKYEEAQPRPSSLIQSLRAFGYDIATAIADLIDNSITAKSTQIEIIFDWNYGEPWIAIVDNGMGMSSDELLESMRLGSQNPLDVRNADDLGRFGLGLKTASFSQCKQLTVASKKNTQLSVRCWDLDLVTETNQWRLLVEGSRVCEKIIRSKLNSIEHGTVVLWEKIDRIIPADAVGDEDYQDAFLAYLESVRDHIAKTYSDFMFGHNKIHFKINGLDIEPWDPFMQTSALTTRMPTEILWANGKQVTIQSYILPHPNKLTPDQFKTYAGSRGWVDQQGFYIYRNRRLIVAGEWLFDNLPKKEQYKLARVRIDIGNEADMEWKIDVKKSVAVPPVSIQKELLRIASAAQRESSKVFRHRGKRMARSAKVEKKYIWHQFVRDGKLGYNINKEHPIIKSLLDDDKTGRVLQLIELIEETVPVPTIISDYSEQPENMLSPFEGKGLDDCEALLDSLFQTYVTTLNFSPTDAIQQIVNTEPFIYIPEVVVLYCERKGISYE